VTVESRDRAALALSREVVLTCDAQGTVRSLDPRAEQLLGGGVGVPLASFAVTGTAGKVTALVERARTERVRDWELSLRFGEGVKTVCFQAEPFDGGVLLVGTIGRDGDADALARVAATANELASLHRETQRQQRELAAKHSELTSALGDLRDSNSGLVALHAQLDEKNDSLQRDADVKARVVANVSHEFRTPINSILGITQLLLDRLDGDLTAEQEKQLRFVRTSAQSLSVLVNDLLDLSRIEAGKMVLRAETIVVADLLTSLRGMMRPLFTTDDVKLVVEPADGLPDLETDNGKIGQILRNLVSNAVKFTERGEVRVRAELAGEGRIAFSVSDTGIGIAPSDQDRVFEEFTQVDSHIQRRVRGTGLGLPLSRKLAQVLGGTLEVRSAIGEGSTFTLTIPLVHEEIREMGEIVKKAEVIDPTLTPVLVLEDDRKTLFLYERYLSRSGFQVLPARTVDEARAVLARTRPAAIVFDVMLEGETTWSLVEEIKHDPRTCDIPLMVVTVVDRTEKARAVGADEFWLKPVDGERLIRKLAELARRGPMTRVLVIDDDEAARYLIRRLLEGTDYQVIETGDAAEGVKLARTADPHVILLDFLLEGATAFDVIDELKVDPKTRSIPIIIQTSKSLDAPERDRLLRDASSILAKEALSREVAITRIRDALLGAGIATKRTGGRP
jgi:signal transduction histidine kinase/CheY-like chemotaxis protein